MLLSYLSSPHSAALPDQHVLLRRRRHRRPHAPVPRLGPRGGQRLLLLGEPVAAGPFFSVPRVPLAVVPRLTDLKVDLLDGRRRHGQRGQHRFGVGAVGPARCLFGMGAFFL